MNSIYWGKNNVIIAFVFILFSLSVKAQNPKKDYNPFVNAGIINPAPLLPLESGGTGIISFGIGNSGSDPLEVFPDHYIILTLSLSKGIPDNANPIAAISGTSSNLFTWTYNNGTFTGTQIATIPSNSTGTIRIDYKVTENSLSGSPENGFNVNLTPAPYQTKSNSQSDDAVSSYTWTEIRDFGDAPLSYGSADHIIDYLNYMGTLVDGELTNQPSSNADADDLNGENDEDGVTFPALTRGASVIIQVKVVGGAYINAWIDWNGNGSFNNTNERIVTNSLKGDETVNIPVTVPQDAIINVPTYARFRFGPRANTNPSYTNIGSATYGEVEDYQITILCSIPPAPIIGTISQPDCNVANGSVVLNGLPSTGTWTIFRNPGGISTEGNGTTTTITNLPEGNYTFTVTNSSGCTSLPSAAVTINAQPLTPTAPVIGNITQPTCSLASGDVTLSGLPSAGLWTLTRTPGGVTTTGTGTSVKISGLFEGIYTYTVENEEGCLSVASENVGINAQPESPDSPLQSINCSLGFGNAVVTVTSPLGSGVTYRLDNGSYQSGTTFSSVANGNHTLSVRNSSGCITTGNIFSVSCGCVNGPVVTLSNTNGATCVTEAVTISGNTFGGSATNVAITENGDGSVNPTSAGTSPFSFTYTPASSDAGKTVTITVTTNNPLGSPCQPSVATYTLTINANPTAPVLETITQPTCALATGSVLLSGLPATGTWVLTRNPGGIVTIGAGTSVIISGIQQGTHTFSVANAAGCESVVSANLVISSQPNTLPSPVIGTITHPTCTVSTGRVVLNGLPSSGSWTLTRSPGGVTSSGTGISTTISNIPQGTYTYVVSTSSGCASAPSANVIINDQPTIPTAPSPAIITPPSCSSNTGSVLLNGMPSVGMWILTRYPGGITSSGQGTNTTVPGLPAGTYNFTVTSNEGCTSLPSANVIIPSRPTTLSAPIVGTIIQPTCNLSTGSVTLTGLPPIGEWTITRSPDGVITSGTGTSTTISGLASGIYNFSITNTTGCPSSASGNVIIIPNPSTPVLIITNPEPVCSPATVDLTSSGITTGSNADLTYTYWINSQATITLNSPSTAPAGIFYIKGTSSAGCSDVKPVTVSISQPSLSNAGPDQVLDYVFSTDLEAFDPDTSRFGVWSVLIGSGNFTDVNFARTTVSDLSVGENIFSWTVTNEVCPPVSDSVIIYVNSLMIPTLLTPNMDGKNDYFIIEGLEEKGKTELIVFDRRGTQVYINKNYNNDWNGVDQNENPLPDDTYFYFLKPQFGAAIRRFIVIRR